jgi:hypothetical protein
MILVSLILIGFYVTLTQYGDVPALLVAEDPQVSFSALFQAQTCT